MRFWPLFRQLNNGDPRPWTEEGPEQAIPLTGARGSQNAKTLTAAPLIRHLNALGARQT